MPFISEILKYKSLSVVGMAKNTGKTVCLNYIIDRLAGSGVRLAVTSVGLDGETVDSVTQTAKPEVFINAGTVFVTSEKHFRQKHLDAEILDISQRQTSLGRLVTARSLCRGNLIFSGPSDTAWLKTVIRDLQRHDIDLVLVDGALSRKSLASPSVTQSMILTTGAALSANINELVRQTDFTYKLINSDLYKTQLVDTLLDTNAGLWAIDDEGELHDLGIASSLMLEQATDRLHRYGNTVFVSGIVTDKLLDVMRLRSDVADTVIVAKDFTKIFVSPEKLLLYGNRGVRLQVLLRPELLAVCVNPVSPAGYVLDSRRLCEALFARLHVPVYDLKAGVEVR